MITIIVHDNRLAGSTPSGATDSLFVSRAWPLSSITDWINDCSARYGYINKLKILCHGWSSHHGGGYGLELGEGVRVQNVHKWSAVAGSIAKIILYSCGAAHISDYGTFDGHGDGYYLCKRLAAHSHAWVIAAIEPQYYTTGFFSDEIDFGDWEGMVLEFSPTGKVRRIK